MRRLDRLSHSIAIIVTIVLASAGPYAQQAPPRDNPKPVVLTGSGVISGRLVTNDTERQALAGAQLMIIGQENGYLKIVESDDQGRFAFSNLPAGRYALGATKPAFVSASYGASRPGRPGTAVTLSEGQRITDLVMKMTRGAVVSGRVTDERGQPLANTIVTLQTVKIVNGERVPVSGLASSMMAIRGGQNAGFASTDDRGTYRLFGVSPGDYIVAMTPSDDGLSAPRALSNDEIQAGLQALRDPGRSASAPGAPVPAIGPPTASSASNAPSGPTMAMVASYFPGTIDASAAATLTLRAGEVREGIDIRAQSVPIARIEGTVLGVNGAPVAAQVTLFKPGSPTSMSALTMMGLAGPQGNTRASATGQFALPRVPPGRYSITARSIPAPGSGRGGGSPEVPASNSQTWASLDVVVSGQNLSGLVLAMQPGMIATGKVVLKSYETAVPKEPSIMVALRPPQATDFFVSLGMTGMNNAVRDDRTFTVENLMPGRYAISAAMNAAGIESIQDMFRWTVESVTVGGRDVTDQLVDLKPGEGLSDIVVTLSDRSASVSGTLQDAAGRAAPEFTMILFAAESRYWFEGSRRIQTARPSTDGRFEFTGFGGLPAGTYYLAALTDFGADEQYDNAFLTELAKSAARFTLAAGEAKKQDLKISR